MRDKNGAKRRRGDERSSRHIQHPRASIRQERVVSVDAARADEVESAPRECTEKTTRARRRLNGASRARWVRAERRERRAMEVLVARTRVRVAVRAADEEE